MFSRSSATIFFSLSLIYAIVCFSSFPTVTLTAPTISSTVGGYIPSFSTSPSSGQQTVTSFNYSGSGLTPNGLIERFGRRPNGGVDNFGNMNASSQGTLSWNYTYNCNDQPGTHSVWIRDVTKNFITPEVTNSVSAHPNCATSSPVVNSIDPPTPPVVNGNQNVRVFGNNFQQGLTVDVFNSSGTRIGTLGGSGQIQNVTSASFTMIINLGSSAGTFGIEVVNPDNRRSPRFAFSTLASTPSPVVNSLNPSSPPVFNGNQSVQVIGNFFQQSLAVDVFNSGGNKISTLSSPGQIQSVSPTSFTMIINLGGSAGSFSIEVVNPDGKRSTRFNFSTVISLPSPMVDSIDPTSPPVINDNQSVRVNGKNFQSNLAVDVFNNVGTKIATLSGPGQIQGVSSTSFTMVVNLGNSAGSFGIEVVNPDGKRSTRFNFSTIAQLAIVLNRPSASCNSVSLTWSAGSVSGFVSYSVYRSTSPNVTTSATLLADITNQSTKSYVDNTLSPGRAYYYRISLRMIRDRIDSNEYSAQRSGGGVPTVTSQPITSATVGKRYSYSVHASDPESDSLTFQIVSPPQGMSIDSQSGLITWTPKQDQVGNHSIRVAVSDGCNQTPQNFTINVTSATVAGSSTINIGGVSLTADRLTEVDASTKRLSGNVSLNNFLRFDGDLDVRQNSLTNATVSGNGAIFIDGIPRLNQVIFRGSFSFTLDGSSALNNLVQSAIGSQLKLAGATVVIDDIMLLNDGVQISGELRLPQIAGASTRITTLKITRSGGIDLAGDIVFPEIRLSSNVSLTDTKVRFDTIQDIFSGSGRIRTPLFLIEPRVEVKMGCLNRVGVEVETNNVGIPIFSTGLKISGGNISLDNLCGGPFSITLGVDISPLDSNLAHIIRLDNMQLTYTLPQTLIGSGTVRIFDSPAASGQVAINDPSGVRVEANGNLADVINGNFKLSIEPPRVSGSVDANLRIPKIDSTGRVSQFIQSVANFPWDVGHINGSFENDRVSVQKKVSFGVASVDMVLKIIFSPGSRFPRIEADGNFTSLINFLSQGELIRPENELAVKRFLSDLAKQGVVTDSAQGLVIQSPQQQGITLPSGYNQVLFSLQGIGKTPEFSLITPDGRRITPTTTGQDFIWSTNPGVFTAFYLISNPQPGFWIVETNDSPTLLDIQASKAPPTITVNANQSSVSSNTDNLATNSNNNAGQVAIQWSASSADPNTTVSLFYDSDNRNADGIKIIDGLRINSSTRSYNWIPTTVPSGDYYVYAVVTDGHNAPVIAYSPNKITVDAPGSPAPPRDFSAFSRENAILASWLPNQEPDLAGYVLRYTSDLNRSDYDKSVIIGMATSYQLPSLLQGKQYRLAIAAYNTNGQTSRLSEAKIVPTTMGNPPVVRITTPNGSESFTTGQSFTVQWVASDDTSIENQQIVLSRDGGLTYPIILADNLSGATRSFLWHLPMDTSGSSFRIRVLARDTAANMGRDESDSDFSIRALAPNMANLPSSKVPVSTDALSLLIRGNNFAAGAVVVANNQRLTTNFVNDTQLMTILPAALLRQAGIINILVENPDGQRSEPQGLVVESIRSVATVSAASFANNELAPESIAAAFGSDLAFLIRVATTLPLPTQLGGTSVRIRDSAGIERLAPLFFVAPTQVNYQIPSGTANGEATITISRGDGLESVGRIQIASVAPGLFSALANGQGIAAAVALRAKANGSQTFEPVEQAGQAVPIDLGPSGDQVYLLLYGTGFHNHSGINNVKLKIGGVDVLVQYADIAPGFIGLDQVNVGPLPRSLTGRGEVDIVLIVDGKSANIVKVNFR